MKSLLKVVNPPKKYSSKWIYYFQNEKIEQTYQIFIFSSRKSTFFLALLLALLISITLFIYDVLFTSILSLKITRGLQLIIVSSAILSLNLQQKGILKIVSVLLIIFEALIFQLIQKERISESYTLNCDISSSIGNIIIQCFRYFSMLGGYLTCINNPILQSGLVSAIIIFFAFQGENYGSEFLWITALLLCCFSMLIFLQYEVSSRNDYYQTTINERKHQCWKQILDEKILNSIFVVTPIQLFKNKSELYDTEAKHPFQQTKVTSLKLEINPYKEITQEGIEEKHKNKEISDEKLTNKAAQYKQLGNQRTKSGDSQFKNNTISRTSEWEHVTRTKEDEEKQKKQKDNHLSKYGFKKEESIFKPIVDDEICRDHKHTFLGDEFKDQFRRESTYKNTEPLSETLKQDENMKKQEESNTYLPNDQPELGFPFFNNYFVKTFREFSVPDYQTKVIQKIELMKDGKKVSLYDKLKEIMSTQCPSKKNQCSKHFNSNLFMMSDEETHVCLSGIESQEKFVFPSCHFSEANMYFDIQISKCTWWGEFDSSEGLIVILNDISQRVTNQRLKQLDKYKDDLLANVSHDFKTPLNGMTAQLQLITRLLKDFLEKKKNSDENENEHEQLQEEQEGQEDQEREENQDDVQYYEQQNEKEQIFNYLYQVEQNVWLLNHLVNDIQDYSQMNNQTLRINISPFILADVINDVQNLMKIQSDTKNIAFEVKSSLKLDKLSVNSDKIRLKQILINLLSNAIKFTYEGSVKLKIETPPPDPNLSSQCGGLLQFEVIDTGIGMTEAIKSNLFKMYGSYDTNKMNKHGVGLGLFISQCLVNLIGPQSEILIDSQVNKGSSFKFQIFQNLEQGKRNRGATYVLSDVSSISPLPPNNVVDFNAILPTRQFPIKSLHQSGGFQNIREESRSFSLYLPPNSSKEQNQQKNSQNQEHEKNEEEFQKPEYGGYAPVEREVVYMVSYPARIHKNHFTMQPLQSSIHIQNEKGIFSFNDERDSRLVKTKYKSESNISLVKNPLKIKSNTPSNKITSSLQVSPYPKEMPISQQGFTPFKSIQLHQKKTPQKDQNHLHPMPFYRKQTSLQTSTFKEQASKRSKNEGSNENLEDHYFLPQYTDEQTVSKEKKKSCDKNQKSEFFLMNPQLNLHNNVYLKESLILNDESDIQEEPPDEHTQKHYNVQILETSQTPKTLNKLKVIPFEEGECPNSNTLRQIIEAGIEKDFDEIQDSSQRDRIVLQLKLPFNDYQEGIPLVREMDYQEKRSSFQNQRGKGNELEGLNLKHSLSIESKRLSLSKDGRKQSTFQSKPILKSNESFKSSKIEKEGDNLQSQEYLTQNNLLPQSNNLFQRRGIQHLFLQMKSLASQILPERKLRILYAEDQIFSVVALQNFFKQLIDVIDLSIAFNGQLALQQIIKANEQGVPFDAALIDASMPVMDGIETIQNLNQLVSQGVIPPIIIVTCTAYTDRQRFIDVGSNYFLSKPTSLETILETLIFIFNSLNSLKLKGFQQSK